MTTGQNRTGGSGAPEDAPRPGGPGFSLVLGTYGRTDDLRILFDSLEAQAYEDFEVIVVDQNADDRLGPILDAYDGSKFPILRLRTSERGLSRAKNLGMEHASRDVIGFLDDNCSFPPDFLSDLARAFRERPYADALTGPSVDGWGRHSNGRFDRTSGPVDKLNAWRRGAAYNIFVRADKTRGARFDEEMGPGAGTPWGAGDETDFLLGLVGRGVRVFYDADRAAVHPQPVARDDEEALRRAHAYARGAGHAVKKHGYAYRFRAWWVLRSAAALAVSLILRPAVRGPAYRWNTLRGKVEGLLK